jgi:hypothetical protein
MYQKTILLTAAFIAATLTSVSSQAAGIGVCVSPQGVTKTQVAKPCGNFYTLNSGYAKASPKTMCLTKNKAGIRSVLVKGLNETCPKGRVAFAVGGSPAVQVSMCLGNANNGQLLKPLSDPRVSPAICRKNETPLDVTDVVFAGGAKTGPKGPKGEAGPDIKVFSGAATPEMLGYFANGSVFNADLQAVVDLDPTTASGLKEYMAGAPTGYFLDNTCATAVAPITDTTLTPHVVWSTVANAPVLISVTATVTSGQLYVQVGAPTPTPTCQAYPGLNISSLYVDPAAVTVTALSAPLSFTTPPVRPLRVELK